MAKRIQPVVETTTVVGAVDICFSELQSLGEELREVCDNTPENLQGSDLYSRRDEAASTLEGISEPTVDESVANIAVEISILRKKRKSRSDRCSEAITYAQAAVEALEQFTSENTEGDAHNEATSAIDEIQSMIDEAEGVEFPGMYG